MTMPPDAARAMLIGGARIDLQNVLLREDILLDELHLEGGDVRIEPPHGDLEARITSGETRVRAVMSEASLNRLVTSSLSADTPIRDLQVAVLSGKARISGKAMVKVVPVPFSLEAVPVIENGVRIVLDCRNASFGIGLPRAVVDVVEQRLNEMLSLDVNDLPIPLWIDELRCEPGRLTAIGRARITWPQLPMLPAVPVNAIRPVSRGFTISAEPLFGEPTPARPAISAAPDPDDSAAVLP
jgi:hypothetical protein